MSCLATLSPELFTGSNNLVLGRLNCICPANSTTYFVISDKSKMKKIIVLYIQIIFKRKSIFIQINLVNCVLCVCKLKSILCSGRQSRHQLPVSRCLQICTQIMSKLLKLGVLKYFKPPRVLISNIVRLSIICFKINQLFIW